MDINYNNTIDTNETIIIKIFEYIKSEKWNLLEKIIKDNKEIDYNIKDISNTYILEYAILFNKINIVKLLLDIENIRIDILDDNNRSILYNVIKFGYIDILNLFIKKNKDLLGLNVFELTDKLGNIPLFYAISFNNLDIIELIMKEMTTLYIKNNNGENGLHLSIKTQNIKTFKLVNKYINNINIKNNNGEQCYHIMIKYKCYDMIEYILNNNFTIDINTTEKKANHTPLHVMCLTLDLKLIDLIKNKVDLINGYTQDISGNIFMHYFINNIINLVNNDNIQIIMDIYNILINIKFDYNSYNIDGNTCCHLIVENKNNIDKFNNNYTIILNDFIKNTNLNIQNNEGYSCFLFLVKNSYWKNMYNVLIEKKIDIFIYTVDKLTCFNFIPKDDYDEFIALITKSYINQLRKKSTSKWIDYWDNRCKININLKELNETEKNMINNIKNNEDICYDIIYKKIIDYSKNFVIDVTKNNKFNSYPLKIINIQLIENYPSVNISTYTGSTLDVLCGLLYINKKYIDICQTSLCLLNVKKPIVDYKDGNCNFIGFEIDWIDYQLHIPFSSSTTLQNILVNNIDKNNNYKYRFFIIPIGIQLYIDNEYYAHANYLLFDFKTQTIERFEPYGSEPPHNMNYNAKLLDNMLKNTIESFKLNFTYIPPSNYLPKIGFQLKEIYETKNDYIGDPNGFCALWSLWWIDIRLKNPDIPIKKLVKILNKEIVNKSHKQLIRNYSGYIVDYRDKILIKSDININDMINEKITKKQADLINDIIISDINNIINNGS